jgi:(S)-2-hydroxyglutarate dehydrogenase
VQVAIIGAGIVGLATGLQLVKRFPGISLAVLDKEPKVAGHQSGHNSGVIHSGIYYRPGSLKATLCLEGAEAMIQFCKENGVPYELCGKLIVATREDELQRLEELYRRGEQNGLKGLEMLSAEEITGYEPAATGIRGIRVPGTGIVDFAKVTQKYAELITAGGGAIYLSHEVTGLKRAHGATVLETNQGSFEAKLVINCAGLQSDRVSRMANASLDLTIVPFRGEYYDLVPGKEQCLRGLLYPVPDPQFPFLGVHFTRRIGGGIEAGPNAVLALEREGYTKTSFRLGDVMEYTTFPGFWIMARRHWRMSMREYHRSWSKASFVHDLQQLMPNLKSEDLIAGGAGVRAQALDRQGRLIDDFRFVHTDGMVHVCNAPSPAATASLVIGRYIVDTVVKHHAAPWAS